MLSLVLSIVFYLGGGKITSGFCVSPGFSSRSNQVKHQVEKSLCWTSFTGTLFKGWLLSKQRGLWKDDFGDVYVLSKSSLGWCDLTRDICTVIHGKWGGPFSATQGFRAGTKWHHCWQAQRKARDRAIAGLRLCARGRKHWRTIVSRLVVLGMWPPDEQYQGPSALECTTRPVHKLEPTQYLGESMHFAFCLFDFVLGSLSFLKSHWKNWLCWLQFWQRLLLWLLLFCYDSPILESTFIGCLLEI